MKQLITILFLLYSWNLSAKVLDKIMAVIDENIITLSQINRIQENLASRKNISPPIYSNENMTRDEVIDLVIRKFLIRDKLAEQGYIIGDEQVESQINATEKRLGLNREALMNFLKSTNLTYNEYFEIIRETIEFNIFQGKVIVPLVNITDQEIKNSFYKQNQSNNTFTFKYHLTDFYLEHPTPEKVKKFKKMLEKYQVNGILPQEFSTMQTNVLGDVTEDGLTPDLIKLLKKTGEGEFTTAIKINDVYHVFFLKKKDLVESEVFNQAKEKIKMGLYEKKAGSMIKVWFKREGARHYLKYFYKRKELK